MEILEALLDEKTKRRLSHKKLTTDELFTGYYDLLKIRITPNQYLQYKALLDKFQAFLGGMPPSQALALKFLGLYHHRAQATIFRYTGIIRGFMDWYGEGLDVKVKKPKHLPEYVEPADIEKLVDAITCKHNHKDTIARDEMLIRFAQMTGLRRSELANLKVSDIQLEKRTVFVRQGKGMKDRAVPIPLGLISKLTSFLAHKQPSDSLFNLTSRSITDKLSTWSKKAGVKIHPHQLRHSYAEQLLEKGAALTSVQALLGHESLQTTSVYLGIRPNALREAVDKLDMVKPMPEQTYLKIKIHDNDNNLADNIEIQGEIPINSVQNSVPNFFKQRIQFEKDNQENT